MKKILLSLGTITTVAIPLTTVISCGNNRSGDKDNKNPATHNEYVPKHDINEYIKSFKDNDFDGFADSLYKSRGSDYFKRYIAPYKSEGGTTNGSFTDSYIVIMFPEGRVIFNYYELYDYAHVQDFINHGIKPDGSDASASFHNSFPYIKNK